MQCFKRVESPAHFFPYVCVALSAELGCTYQVEHNNGAAGNYAVMCEHRLTR